MIEKKLAKGKSFQL